MDNKVKHIMAITLILSVSLPVKATETVANSANETKEEKKWVEHDPSECVTMNDISKEKIEAEMNKRIQRDIESHMDSYLLNYPEYTTNNKTIVADGDYVNLSLVGYIDGEQIPSIEIEEFITQIGSRTLPTELEMVLIGKEVGKEVYIQIDSKTFNESFGGCSAIFEAKINGIVNAKFYTHETLTDEYVTGTLGHASIKAFYEKLEEEMSVSIEQYKQTEIMSILDSISSVTFPTRLIAQMADQHKQLIINQLFDGEEELYNEMLPTYMGCTATEYDNYLYDQYITQTARNLILLSIAQKENLKAEGEDYEQYVEYMKVNNNLETTEALYKYYDTEYESGKEYISKQYLMIAAMGLYCDYSFADLQRSLAIDVASEGHEITQLRNFKSYMGYHTITDKTSKQYKMQQQAETSMSGLRMIEGRYCMAIGTYFGASVGQYIDVVLENGIVINGVVGDIKADVDTESNNIFTSVNGCCSEFIVDADVIPNNVRFSGNVSNLYEEWNSPVASIQVYEQFAEY